jgi:uncharacterized protein with HEPN domain
MPKRDPDLLIGDMVECCANIFEYTSGITFYDFTCDKKTRDAVIRNFEVLGEAARRIPDDIRLANNQIEWRKISDLRNVLIHEYFGINYETVWKIIEDYLPGQYEELKRLAATLS